MEAVVRSLQSVSEKVSDKECRCCRKCFAGFTYDDTFTVPPPPSTGRLQLGGHPTDPAAVAAGFFLSPRRIVPFPPPPPFPFVCPRASPLHRRFKTREMHCA